MIMNKTFVHMEYKLDHIYISPSVIIRIGDLIRADLPLHPGMPKRSSGDGHIVVSPTLDDSSGDQTYEPWILRLPVDHRCGHKHSDLLNIINALEGN